MIKLKENDIVLFQGDSITDGNRGRNSDLNHIHGHGYQYILAAELSADNIDKNIEFVNRGISGNRIADLYGRWVEDCLNIKPTILSMLIGVNDIIFNWEHNSGSNPQRYEQIYRYLLDEVKKQNPDTLIVIMEPFFGEKEDKVLNKYFKEHIGDYAKAARKIAEEYNAVFVPLQDMIDSYAEKTDIYNILWDGVHPTTCGHELIARRWKECVQQRIEER